MTTDTETRWVYSFVPEDMRDEGHQLLTEVRMWQATSQPLLERCGRHLARSDILADQLTEELTTITGPNSQADDAVHAIVIALTLAGELNRTLAAAGIDPDACIAAAMGCNVPIGGDL